MQLTIFQVTRLYKERDYAEVEFTVSQSYLSLDKAL